MQRQHWYTAPTVGPGNVFTGNRILAPDAKGGFGDPSAVNSVVVELPSEIKWIVAANGASAGAKFVATTDDGSAYSVGGANGIDSVQRMDYTTTNPERPPLVLTDRDEATGASVVWVVELPASAQVSPLSHPVPVFCNPTEEQCVYVFVDTKGDIVLYDLGEEQKLAEITNVNALQDARIVVAPKNPLDPTKTASSMLLAVYGGATTYSHCVLGDCIEGSSLLFIQVVANEDGSYSMTVERQIALPAGTVFEGLSPMFIMSGETVVTTVANASNGAWLRTYDVFCGTVVSESPYIGWGWRHLLFFNDFAFDSNDGPLYSLVEVLTPHVRKELEFFHIDSKSGAMTKRASTSKFTTHDIGWRYLDTAISGDLNGDGVNEAVVLDESLQSLVSFQLMSGGIQEAWSLPMGGKLSSNIAAVSYSSDSDNGIALAAASGATMHVWTSSSPESTNMVATAHNGTSTLATAFTDTTSAMKSSALPTSSPSSAISPRADPKPDDEGNRASDQMKINCGALRNDTTVSRVSLASLVALAVLVINTY